MWLKQGLARKTQNILLLRLIKSLFKFMFAEPSNVSFFICIASAKKRRALLPNPHHIERLLSLNLPKCISRSPRRVAIHYDSILGGYGCY